MWRNQVWEDMQIRIGKELTLMQVQERWNTKGKTITIKAWSSNYPLWWKCQ
jgi:hypothetical protein